MSEEKKWYNGDWFKIFFGSLILAPIGTMIYDGIKDVPILTTFKISCIFLYDGIISILTFKISLWIVILIVALILFLVEYGSDSDEPKSESKNFLEYKADKFYDLVWVWEWILNPLINKYEVKHLVPTCKKPACNNMKLLELNLDYTTKSYYCNKCKASHAFDTTTLQSIEYDILTKVSNKNF